MNALHEPIDKLFQLVELILLLRILLTWFPVDWWKQPFKFIQEFADPIFAPFRKLIPPIGGFDLSPIVAFMAINFLQGFLLMLI